MALAASNALPPPSPMTSSQRSAFARATPLSTVEISGSPATEKVAARRLHSRRIFSNFSARRASRPVTTSARQPNSLAAAATSLTAPAPKMIRVGAVNSNREFTGVNVGENVVELHAVARLGHHGRNDVTPDWVMPGFLVCGSGLGVATNFHQHETS